MAVYPNSTLQSTSHPTGQIPAAGEEAIGMTVRVPTLALVSSVPLTDGVIFVDVGWSAPQGENPGQCISGCFKTDEAPISGWAANYPTPGNTVNMALQTGPQSNLNGHNNIELSALTATTFEIEVSFLATRDNDGFLPAEDDSGNLLTLSPNGLLTESSINSIAEFSTAAPSIYSRDGRIFYVDVAHRDFTTGAINRLTFEMPLRARHWSKNVDGVRYADTEGMTVTLDLNKKPATVLSTVGVTTVTWRLRTPIAIPATYWAGIFKVNEADQGGDAVTNLGLNLALSPGLQAVPGIPFSAISGMTPPVSLAPQYYEGAFDLNGAELERGKTYRPYIVFEDGIGNRYPEIGPAIRSGQQAPPIAGNVTQLLMTYDASDKQWTADSLNRVAPLERVRIVVTMDKSSYNADAFLNNAGGYFNNNFESLRFYLSTEPPVTVSEALALSSEAPTDQLTDAPTSLTFDRTFRVPGEYADQTIYANVIWVFAMPGGYKDVAVKPYRLNVNDFDDGPNGAGWLSLVSLKDENGIDLPTNAICVGEIEEVEACFEWSGPNPGDISFIPFFRLINAGINEHNPYVNTVVERIEQTLVKSSDTDFNTGQACVTLDARAIPTGIKFCIGAIAKEGALAPNPDPPPVGVQCPTFTVTTTQTISNVTFQQYEVTVEMMVSAIGGGASHRRTLVQMNTNDLAAGGDAQNWGAVASFNNPTSLFSRLVLDAPGNTGDQWQSRPKTIQVQYDGSIDIVLTDKSICSYPISFVLFAQIEVGAVPQVEVKVLNVVP